MPQYFKLTYKRRQVVTDYLGADAIRETVNEFVEVIGGLPASTIASYRKVLGTQVVSVEPEYASADTRTTKPERGKRRQASRTLRGKAAEAADEDSSVMDGSYGALVSKMAEKEAA